MNPMWKQYKKAQLAVSPIPLTRKRLRDMLRTEPELKGVRKLVFGANPWR